MDTKIIEVTYHEGMKVSANVDGTTIPTDQSVKDGGDGSAPDPLQLFLASLATCAASYARRFCEARKLPTTGLALRMRCDFAPKGIQLETVTYELTLPEGFPEKYVAAITRALDLCTVKKQIVHAPQFRMEIR